MESAKRRRRMRRKLITLEVEGGEKWVLARSGFVFRDLITPKCWGGLIRVLARGGFIVFIILITPKLESD